MDLAAADTASAAAAAAAIERPSDAGTSTDDAPASAASPSASASQQQQPSLDAELQNVFKGFGSFWGKVRQQSASALQQAEQQLNTAQRDLAPMYERARKNVERLSEHTRAEFERLANEQALANAGVSGDRVAEAREEGQGSNTEVIIGADGIPIIVDKMPRQRVDKGKAVDRSGGLESQDESARARGNGHDDDDDDDPAKRAAHAASAFFTRLQDQFSPAMHPKLSAQVAQLQKQVADGAASLPHVVDSLQHSLTRHVEHVNNNNKGGIGEIKWVHDVRHELEKLAHDAIRLVPPPPDSQSSDLVARSGRSKPQLFFDATTGTDGSGTMMTLSDGSLVSRSEALVRRLRTDPRALLVDPATEHSDDDALLAEYAEHKASMRRRDGDGDGDGDGDDDEPQRPSAKLSELIDAELAAPGASEPLRELEHALVPAQLSRQELWTRYFWRKTLIARDESRRRKVLDEVAARDAEDDFSWDMDDDSASEADGAPPSGARPSGEAGPVEKQEPTPTRATTTTTSNASPRASSDGTSSYDVVGQQSGVPSEAGGEPPSPERAAVPRQPSTTTTPASSSQTLEAADLGATPKKTLTSAPQQQQQDDSDDSDWE